jgi:hypothetical protein
MQTHDIAVQRNAEYLRNWSLVDGNRDPVDLTGSTFALDIKYAAGAPDPPLASGTVAIEGDPVNGVISVHIDGADFAALPGDQEVVRLAYDLVATQAGLKMVLARGALLLQPGVS